MRFFYRFLRNDDDGLLKSELTSPITFYTQDQCAIDPNTGRQIDADFTRNPPVMLMKQKGGKPQLLFGMTDQSGCIGVYNYFGQPKRVLARFLIDSSTIRTSQAQIMIDQQVEQGSGISKYIMAPFHEHHLYLPDNEVEVLSANGWVNKAHAQHVSKTDIKGIRNADYASLIKQFVT